MALSKRDQRTLTITLALVLGFVVWTVGISPVWNSYQEVDEKLQVERDKYFQNQKTLSEGTKIDQGYARVEAQFPKDDPDRDASEVFNEEVVDLVKDTIGLYPEYSPPNRIEIKGATGYEFLILPLSFKSTLGKVAALLKEFDKKGYLIQTSTITRDSDLDKDELSVELNLGRIVKIPTEEDEGSGPAKPGSLKLGKRGAR